jgi:threonine dehydrogenase-like Zn-dependent dehydrogenase
MMAARRGGRIVIAGNTSGPQAEIDIRYIFGKQISLIGGLWVAIRISAI